VNAQTWAGWTALHHAATAGYKEIVFELLRAGADPDIKLVLNGYTPCLL
jgi:ankyrin repeat protein